MPPLSFELNLKEKLSLLLYNGIIYCTSN